MKATAMKFFLISAFLGLVSSFGATGQPNIVLILVDDMGYSDLGCYGSEIETPNLDRLADNGIRFTNFTNDAKCGPSRTSLMSGRFHSQVKGAGFGSVITIPEILGQGGYQSFMLGKWHIFDTPLERGFDRMYGFMEGWCNSLTGEWKGEQVQKLDGKPHRLPEGLTTTQAYTEFAERFIRERDPEKPFFLYLAYNAPHYPLHAPEADVMKYRGRYQDGWGALRESRLEKMKALGIVPQGQQLSPTDVASWDSLTDAERDRQDLVMATYAAMIDGLDCGVGQLVETLQAEGLFEDTLILFLSDNGACPFERTELETLENNYMPWDARSFYTYSEPWANACNTPWSKYKQNQHEGGISTPLIAHWPNGIANPGRLDRGRGHIVDFHATFRHLLGLDCPDQYRGHLLGQPPGLSLAAAFAGQPRPLHEELFYSFNKFSALTQGRWKVVDQQYLFNLEDDRIEANDLRAERPELFQSLKNRWDELDQSFR
ncbi:arylsulfatase [Puniceicoccales bacterium CK1056]|uniref:Arylsulfatase n=1 Tax=Oceanipulchritudo coccoides TaxID=2706888 RepID=A0A6B2LZS5_9BACT|nr:arylsulfatase [Oceanipulchritudo coccoides]NDV61005.1 arylsulfatase [Oceanipulchritudo coccoides]